MNKYSWLPMWAKKAIWFCFYKPRGVKFNLPGPTSTSHPFGMVTIMKDWNDKGGRHE